MKIERQPSKQILKVRRKLPRNNSIIFLPDLDKWQKMCYTINEDKERRQALSEQR
jgi:hypothetical protein